MTKTDLTVGVCAIKPPDEELEDTINAIKPLLSRS